MMETRTPVQTVDSKKENDLVLVTDGLLPPFGRAEWMSGKLTCITLTGEIDTRDATAEKNFDEILDLKDSDLTTESVRKVTENVR